MNKLKLKIETEVPEIALKSGYSTETNISDLLNNLQLQAKFQGIEFVYGSGKRKSKLQRSIEKLSKYLERMSKYEEAMQLFKGRNSYSKTDKDATFMRMKDDHMRNGQLKAGYNVQLAVESEYIGGLKLFANPTDVNTLVPFLEEMKNQTNRTITNLVADAGYESEENYTYLNSNNQNPYIKPND